MGGRLAAISMSSFDPPPIRPPFGGVRVDLGGRKWYQPKFRPHIPIRLLYTLYAYIAPFSHNIQRGRQTDRAMAIGHLCCGIGGLIKLIIVHQK